MIAALACYGIALRRAAAGQPTMLQLLDPGAQRPAHRLQ